MRKTSMAMVMVLGLGLGGCAKRSAESAIAQAEKSIAAMQADAEKVAPNELKSLTDSVAAMKARVGAGDYSGALMGARTINTLSRDLRANLASRKDQLTSSFNTLSAELPKQLDQVMARITELGGMRKLPTGIDPAKFAALKTESAGWAAAWKSATDAFAAGNLAAALADANQIKAKLADAMKTIGLA